MYTEKQTEKERRREGEEEKGREREGESEKKKKRGSSDIPYCVFRLEQERHEDGKDPVVKHEAHSEVPFILFCLLITPKRMFLFKSSHLLPKHVQHLQNLSIWPASQSCSMIRAEAGGGPRSDTALALSSGKKVGLTPECCNIC